MGAARIAARAASFVFCFSIITAESYASCARLIIPGAGQPSKEESAATLEAALADITGGAFVVPDERGLSVRVTSAIAKWQVEKRHWLGWDGYVVHSRLAWHSSEVVTPENNAPASRAHVGDLAMEVLLLKYYPGGVQQILDGKKVHPSWLRPKTVVEKIDWGYREAIAKGTWAGQWPSAVRIDVEAGDDYRRFVIFLKSKGDRVDVTGVRAREVSDGTSGRKLVSVFCKFLDPQTFWEAMKRPGVDEAVPL